MKNSKQLKRLLSLLLVLVMVLGMVPLNAFAETHITTGHYEIHTGITNRITASDYTMGIVYTMGITFASGTNHRHNYCEDCNHVWDTGTPCPKCGSSNAKGTGSFGTVTTFNKAVASLSPGSPYKVSNTSSYFEDSSVPNGATITSSTVISTSSTSVNVTHGIVSQHCDDIVQPAVGSSSSANMSLEIWGRMTITGTDARGNSINFDSGTLNNSGSTVSVMTQGGGCPYDGPNPVFNGTIYSPNANASSAFNVGVGDSTRIIEKVERVEYSYQTWIPGINVKEPPVITATDHTINLGAAVPGIALSDGVTAKSGYTSQTFIGYGVQSYNGEVSMQDAGGLTGPTATALGVYTQTLHALDKTDSTASTTTRKIIVRTGAAPDIIAKFANGQLAPDNTTDGSYVYTATDNKLIDGWTNKSIDVTVSSNLSGSFFTTIMRNGVVSGYGISHAVPVTDALISDSPSTAGLSMTGKLIDNSKTTDLSAIAGPLVVKIDKTPPTPNATVVQDPVTKIITSLTDTTTDSLSGPFVAPNGWTGFKGETKYALAPTGVNPATFADSVWMTAGNLMAKGPQGQDAQGNDFVHDADYYIYAWAWDNAGNDAKAETLATVKGIGDLIGNPDKGVDPTDPEQPDDKPDYEQILFYFSSYDISKGTIDYSNLPADKKFGHPSTPTSTKDIPANDYVWNVDSSGKVWMFFNKMSFDAILELNIIPGLSPTAGNAFDYWEGSFTGSDPSPIIGYPTDRTTPLMNYSYAQHGTVVEWVANFDKDIWNSGEDPEGDEIPVDPEDPSGPDGIPDKYQVLFTFNVDPTGHGMLQYKGVKYPQVKLIRNKYDSGILSTTGIAMLASADVPVPMAEPLKAFMNWYDNTANVDLKVGDKTAPKGQYADDNVFTALFGVDEIGGTDPNTPPEKPGGPDGIPDEYQVIFTFKPEAPTFGTLTIKDFTGNTTDDDPNNNNNGVKIGNNVYVVKTRVDSTGAFTTNPTTKVTLTNVDVPAVEGNAALKKAFVWWIDDTNAPAAIEGMGIGDTVAPAGDYTAPNLFIAKFADDIIGPDDPFNPEIPDGIADIFQVLFQFQLDSSLLDEYYTFGGSMDGQPYYVVKTRYADLAQTKYSTTADVKLEEADVPKIRLPFADGYAYSVFDYWAITEIKTEMLVHVVNEKFTDNEPKAPATERLTYGTYNGSPADKYTITAYGTPDVIGVVFPWIDPLPPYPFILPDGIADKYQILFTFDVDANGNLVPDADTAHSTAPLQWVGTKRDSNGKLVVNKVACDAIVVNLPANIVPGVENKTGWAFDFWSDDTKPANLTIGDLKAPAGNYVGKWDATLGYYVQDFTANFAEDIHGKPEDPDDPDPEPDDVPDKYQTAFHFHAGAHGTISLGDLTGCDEIIVYATKYDSNGDPSLTGTATLRADQIPTGTGDVVDKGTYIFDHWHDDETNTDLTDEYPNAPIAPSLSVYVDEETYHFTVIWDSDVVGLPENPDDPTTGGGDGIPDKFQEPITYTVDQLAHGNLTLGTLANLKTIITYATFYKTDGVTFDKKGTATIDPDDVPSINSNTGFAFDLWNSSLNGPLSAGKRKAPANETAPFAMGTDLIFTANFDIDEVGKPDDPDDPDPEPDGIPDKYQIPMTFKHGDHGKLSLGNLKNRNTIRVYITRYDSAGLWSITGDADLTAADIPDVKADKNYAFANWYDNTLDTAMTPDDLKAPVGTYTAPKEFEVEYDEDIVGLPEDPTNPNDGGGDGILDKYQEAVTYTTDGNGKLTLVTTAVNSEGATVNINLSNKDSIVTYATFRDVNGQLDVNGKATIEAANVPTPNAKTNYAFDVWYDGATRLTIGKTDAPADVAEFTKGTNKAFEATFAEDVEGDPEEPNDPKPHPDGTPDKYQIPMTFSGGDHGKLTLGNLKNKNAIVVYITKYDSNGDWSETGDAVLDDAEIPDVTADKNYAFANWYDDTLSTAMTPNDLKAPAGTYNAPNAFKAEYDEDIVGLPEDPDDPNDGGGDGILDKYQEAITYATDGNGKLTLGNLKNRNRIVTYATFRDTNGDLDVNGTATIDAANIPAPVANKDYAFDFWADGVTPLTLGKLDAPADTLAFAKGANKAFTANFDEDIKGQPEDPDNPDPKPDDIPDKYQEGIIFQSDNPNEGLLSLGTLKNKARIRAYVTFRDAAGNYDLNGTATIDESIVPTLQAKTGFAFDIWENVNVQSGDPAFVPLDKTAPKNVLPFSSFAPNERTFTANFDVDEKGDPDDPDDPEDPKPDDIPDKYQVAISFNGGNGKLTLGNLKNRNNIIVYVDKLDGTGNYSVNGTATLTDDLIPDVVPANDEAFLNWIDVTAGNTDLARGDLKSPAGTYTADNAFTVKYAEDKIGQPEDPDDPVPGPDGIPDMYQESIIFKSDDEDTGLLTLGTLVDKARIRVYVTFKDVNGEFDENGNATIDEASVPTPSGTDGYAFDIWNNDQPQSGDIAFAPLDKTAPKTVAPFAAMGNDNRTFTANFDVDIKGQPEDTDDPDPKPDDVPDKYQVGVVFRADANGTLSMGSLTGRKGITVYINLFDSAGKYDANGQGVVTPDDVPNPIADTGYAFDLWKKNGTDMTVLDKDAPADGIPFTKTNAPAFMAYFDEDTNDNDTPDKYEYFKVTLVAGPNGTVTGDPVEYGVSAIVIPPAPAPASGIHFGSSLNDYSYTTPTATADKGHYFHKWLCSADGNFYNDLQVQSLSIKANTTFTAIFLSDANPVLPEIYEITYKIAGPGTIDGAKTPIVVHVPEGSKLDSTVPVSAADDNTVEFIGWYDKNGNKVADTDAELKDIIPTEDTVYTAKFAAKPTNHIKFIAGPGGTLNTPAEFDVAYDLTMNDYGFTVPTAATGTIQYWYDVTTNPSIIANRITNPALIEAMTFNSDTVFVAIFDNNTIIHEVTLIAGDNGKLNKTEDQIIVYVPHGQKLGDLIPSTDPDSGYKFSNWKDKDGKTVDLINKIIEEDATYTANFVKGAGPSGPGGGGETDPELETADHMAYIIGYPDGGVHPGASITRAEVATILFRLLTDSSRSAYWSQSNSYSDVSGSGWYNNAISTLSSAGIVNGYPDGTFRPDAPVTRAELAAMVSRFGNLQGGGVNFTDVSSDHWAYAYIVSAASKGWVLGYPDGTFKPDQFISRAETVTLINRVLGRDKLDDASFHADMKVWPDNTSGTWYYSAVQEATNSHDYDFAANGNETWTAINPPRDWAALEKTWSSAN